MNGRGGSSSRPCLIAKRGRSRDMRFLFSNSHMVYSILHQNVREFDIFLTKCEKKCDFVKKISKTIDKFSIL